MVILSGIDEVGYGPLLGPLVVPATAHLQTAAEGLAGKYG